MGSMWVATSGLSFGSSIVVLGCWDLCGWSSCCWFFIFRCLFCFTRCLLFVGLCLLLVVHCLLCICFCLLFIICSRQAPSDQNHSLPPVGTPFENPKQCLEASKMVFKTWSRPSSRLLLPSQIQEQVGASSFWHFVRKRMFCLVSCEVGLLTSTTPLCSPRLVF